MEVSKRLTEVTTGTMTTETIGMASQAISQIVSSADNPAISFNVDVSLLRLLVLLIRVLTVF